MHGQKSRLGMPVIRIRKAPSRKIQKPVPEEKPYRKEQRRFSRNNAKAAETAFPGGMQKRSDVLSVRRVGKRAGFDIENIRNGDARDSFLHGLPSLSLSGTGQGAILLKTVPVAVVVHSGGEISASDRGNTVGHAQDRLRRTSESPFQVREIMLSAIAQEKNKKTQQPGSGYGLLG